MRVQSTYHRVLAGNDPCCTSCRRYPYLYFYRGLEYKPHVLLQGATAVCARPASAHAHFSMLRYSPMFAEANKFFRTSVLFFKSPNPSFYVSHEAGPVLVAERICICSHTHLLLRLRSGLDSVYTHDCVVCRVSICRLRCCHNATACKSR